MKCTEIIGAVSITDVFVGLGGDQPKNGHARAFWRDGDNPQAVSLNDAKGCWYDHRDNVGGGILDLIRRVRGGTRSDALEWLAELKGVSIDSRPFRDRASIAATREHRRASTYFASVARIMCETALESLAPEDPSRAIYTELLAPLRTSPLSEYTAWCEHQPLFTAALVRAGRSRQRRLRHRSLPTLLRRRTVQREQIEVEDDALAILRSHAPANTPEPEKPNLLSYLNNDHGNAERLIALLGKDLRYCHPFRKWLVWDGKRWAVDQTDQARKLAKRAMLELMRQAIEAGNQKAETFARGSLDARRITNALAMAECEIYVKPADLDGDPYLLNFINGTVDLRTGELSQHRRENLITKLIHYEYRSEAACPRWLAFLDQIMGGGPDAGEVELDRAQRLCDYLQRAFGYSLTGYTIEKVVFVLFGAGDNGKSTMLSTVRQLVEEYSALLQVDTLMVRQESNNTQADLADLRGARFVQTSETEEGQRLAQGKLKRITQGMGKIKAVRKYENPIEFAETHKLWMDTNRKPTIKDADDRATFSRLHPIPLLVRIPKAQIDRDMPRKLLEEAEGILAWAVEGAKLWHESGLSKPPEVQAANEKWRSEMDQVGRFIGERCLTGKELSALSSTLYAEYKQWTAISGEEHVISQKAFGTKLADPGRYCRGALAGWDALFWHRARPAERHGRRGVVTDRGGVTDVTGSFQK